jgi:hypothetical protein
MMTGRIDITPAWKLAIPSFYFLAIFGAFKLFGLDVLGGACNGAAPVVLVTGIWSVCIAVRAKRKSLRVQLLVAGNILAVGLAIYWIFCLTFLTYLFWNFNAG